MQSETAGGAGRRIYVVLSKLPGIQGSGLRASPLCKSQISSPADFHSYLGAFLCGIYFRLHVLLCLVLCSSVCGFGATAASFDVYQIKSNTRWACWPAPSRAASLTRLRAVDVSSQGKEYLLQCMIRNISHATFEFFSSSGVVGYFQVYLQYSRDVVCRQRPRASLGCLSSSKYRWPVPLIGKTHIVRRPTSHFRPQEQSAGPRLTRQQQRPLPCSLEETCQWGKLCTHRSMVTAGGALRTKVFTATWPSFTTDTNAYAGTRTGRRGAENQHNAPRCQVHDTHCRRITRLHDFLDDWWSVRMLRFNTGIHLQ